MSLDRFLSAQEGVIDTALAELRAGAKRSHWMWFVFPQLRGLGRSPTAQHFGIAGLDEATAYLAHSTLGPRLIAAAEAMLAHAGRAPDTILGPVDALKLRSCATLFAAVPDAPPVFQTILATFYEGEGCAPTQAFLLRQISHGG